MHASCAPALARTQQGQAIVEATMALAVLTLLAALTVLVGKYQSAQHSVIAASRYLAFECTARPAACRDAASVPELVDDVRWRVLSHVDAPVRTLQAQVDEPTARHRNPLWVDARNQPLLQRFADVGGQIGQPSFDAGAAVASGNGARVISNAVDLLSDLAGPGRFGLGLREGLADARVQVPFGRAAVGAAEGASLPRVALRARTVVLTDAWTASGPSGASDSVQARVEQGQRLAQAAELAAELAYAPTRALLALSELGPLEPTAGDFRYHEIDMDLVPADRIAR